MAWPGRLDARGTHEIVESAAAVVIGHRSFRDFSSYWPERETAEDASDAERRFASSYNPLPKVVASRDPSSVQVPERWRENTRVVSDDALSEVSRLKEQADGDVLVWGSRDLWTQLWAAGLVDELHLVSGTGVAAGGTPVFPDDPDVALMALETRLLPDSACVLTTYAACMTWGGRSSEKARVLRLVRGSLGRRSRSRNRPAS